MPEEGKVEYEARRNRTLARLALALFMTALIIAAVVAGSLAAGSTNCATLAPLWIIAYLPALILLLTPWVGEEELRVSLPTHQQPPLGRLKGLLSLYYSGLITREQFLAELRKIARQVSLHAHHMSPNEPLAKWAVLVDMWRRKMLSNDELMEKIDALRHEWKEQPPPNQQ